MSEPACLLLRVDDPDDASGAPLRAAWQWCDMQGTILAQNDTPQPLEAIARKLPADIHKTMPHIVILLSGQRVLLTRAPAMGGYASDMRSMSKASAYAVEDQLAEPAEDVHSAIGSTQDRVAVIRNRWIQQITAELKAAGLRPDVITSEALLLPCESGKAAVLAEGSHVLFRLCDRVASRMGQDAFLIFFEHYLAGTKIPASDLPALTALQLWTTGGTADFQAKLQGLCRNYGILLTSTAAEGSAFDWLCQRWFTRGQDAETINLLQGPYAHTPQHAWLANLRTASLIAGAWFIAQIVFNLGCAYYFNDKADSFRAQSEATYHRLFPSDTRIVDLKAQFLQHLAPDAASDNNFVQLLTILAGGMEQAHHPEIQSLQYDAAKNELTAEIIASDFTSLEAFKQQDADVEIGSAVKEGDGIRGQVRIRSTARKKQHG